MRKTLFIAVFVGLALSPATRADVLAVPPPTGEAMAPVVRVPGKGESMRTVTREFGQPRVKHPTVGGASRRQPPITRWDYDGFSVVFERDKTIDVIVAGAPAPVQTVDELVPAP